MSADARERERGQVAPVVRVLAERAGQPEEAFEPDQAQLQTRGWLDVAREQRVEVAGRALDCFERTLRAGQRVVNLLAARQALKLFEVERYKLRRARANLLAGEALVAQRLRDDLQVGHPRHGQPAQTPRPA